MRPRFLHKFLDILYFSNSRIFDAFLQLILNQCLFTLLIQLSIPSFQILTLFSNNCSKLVNFRYSTKEIKEIKKFLILFPTKMISLSFTIFDLLFEILIIQLPPLNESKLPKKTIENQKFLALITKMDDSSSHPQFSILRPKF